MHKITLIPVRLCFFSLVIRREQTNTQASFYPVVLLTDTCVFDYYQRVFFFLLENNQGNSLGSANAGSQLLCCTPGYSV